MPERHRLAAAPRRVFGKKVKRLRREGQIPANVMEAGRSSTAIQAPERDLAELARAQVSGQIIDLQLEGVVAPVLVDGIDVDALTNRLIHATFRKVDMTRPIEVTVRVQLHGSAPASESGEHTVMQLLQEVDVSALPTDIPSLLTADVSGLAEVGDAVLVRDLRAADGAFEPVTAQDAVVAQVSLGRQLEDDEADEELGEVPLEEGAVLPADADAEPPPAAD